MNEQTFSYTDDAGTEHNFRVQDVIDSVKGRTPVQFPVERLLPGTGLDSKRIEQVDLSYPLLIDRGFNAPGASISHGFIDGRHRAAKARQLGLETLPVHFVDIDTVPKMAAYQEEPTSTVTHGGRRYNLNALLRRAEGSSIDQTPIDQLQWILQHDTPDPSRVAKADITAPLLVTQQDGRTVTLDGLHRLARAVQEGATSLPTRTISMNEKTAWYLGHREKLSAAGEYRPRVSIFLHDDQGRVLASPTSYGGYDFPGGGVDPGESPSRAAAREALEEVGWRAGKVRALRGMRPYQYDWPESLKAERARRGRVFEGSKTFWRTAPAMERDTSLHGVEGDAMDVSFVEIPEILKVLAKSSRDPENVYAHHDAQKIKALTRLQGLLAEG